MALIETKLSSWSAEADLITRLQKREPSAFEELLDAYQDPVYRFVYRLIEDPTEAPDVAQEVFIKVFRKIPDFRADSSLKTWIYRIAMNEASNRRRWFSRHRKQETSMDAWESPSMAGNGLADERQGPYDLTYRREQLEIVELALREMDERLRVAVVLRDIEELSYNEIAAVLEVSLGTVKSRILRGRETLKTNLQRYLQAAGPEPCLLQPE